jgi:hypothetical protein
MGKKQGAFVLLIAAVLVLMHGAAFGTAQAADKGGAGSGIAATFDPAPASKSWTGFYGSLGAGYSTTDVVGLELGASAFVT